MSQVVDSSPGVILGKAEVRKLILGKYSFNIAQGDKKEFSIIISSVDKPKRYQELYLRGEM